MLYLARQWCDACWQVAAKEFKVYVQKQQPKKPGGSYSIDHSAGTFILDGQGRLRLFVLHGAAAASLLGDIKTLLKQAS